MKMQASDAFERELTILDSINEGVFTVDRDWRITARFTCSASKRPILTVGGSEDNPSF